MGEKINLLLFVLDLLLFWKGDWKVPAHPLTASGDFTDFCHIPITHFASWKAACLLCEGKPFQQLNSFVSQVSGSTPDLSSGIKPQISHFMVTWHQVCLLGEVKLSPWFRFYINRRRERKQAVTAATFCRLLLGHSGERWPCVSVPALLIAQSSGTFAPVNESGLTAGWMMTRSKVIAPNLLWWKWRPLWNQAHWKPKNKNIHSP